MIRKSSDPCAEITRLLHGMAEGEVGASQDLFVALYDQLRQMAQRAMSGQPLEHTLQPTALVNEAYLRVTQSAGPGFVNRGHFLAVASKAMRQLLVDHARKKASDKRTSGGVRVGLEAVLETFQARSQNLEGLNAALEDFSLSDPGMAAAIELRFFGGASVEEAAESMGVSTRTFERRWQVARHYLRAQLLAS